MEEKVILPLDIYNSDHIDELLSDPETYGCVIKDLLKVLGKEYKKLKPSVVGIPLEYEYYEVRVVL